jgi:hypothetical protein
MELITNPISNIPVHEKSHTRGWSLLWKEQLGIDLDVKCSPNVIKADRIYIDHGVNFGGTLNLFGGATKELFDRINRVMANPNVISLDWDMPDYGAMLKKRLSAKTTYTGITKDWCDKVSKRIETIQSVKQQDLFFDNVILGDSHTLSFSDHHTMVFRNDGKTLFGAMKSGFDTLMRGAKPKGRLTLCFGSIDIRHHILRQADFNLDAFLDEYVSKGTALAKDVWFCAPVPVEFEGRKVPKTGYYKGEPFYGSLAERRKLTNDFIVGLKARTDKVVQPPAEWYTMDPEKYANTFMEYGGSFHIAPPYYNRNEWGVVNLGT